MEKPQGRAPVFRPRFTLSLLYLVGFFFLYALILVAPELASVAEPGGPQNEAALRHAAEEAARQAIRPRLPMALVAALASVALGARWRLLPGLR